MLIASCIVWPMVSSHFAPKWFGVRIFSHPVELVLPGEMGMGQMGINHQPFHCQSRISAPKHANYSEPPLKIHIFEQQPVPLYTNKGHSFYSKIPPPGKKLRRLATCTWSPISKAVLVYLRFGSWRGSKLKMGLFSLKCILLENGWTDLWFWC